MQLCINNHNIFTTLTYSYMYERSWKFWISTEQSHCLMAWCKIVLKMHAIVFRAHSNPHDKQILRNIQFDVHLEYYLLILLLQCSPFLRSGLQMPINVKGFHTPNSKCRGFSYPKNFLQGVFIPPKIKVGGMSRWTKIMLFISYCDISINVTLYLY